MLRAVRLKRAGRRRCSNAAMAPTLAPCPIFLSHGSPWTALEPREAGAFMQRLGPAIDAVFGRPRAVLAVSAHTLERMPLLLAAARHAAVHDFGGFDERLHRLRYDAPGDPALATQVEALLRGAGIAARRAEQGGLDHGIWTPLRYLWPAADVPVLPLAFVPTWSPRRLFDFGAALAPLAAQGVLVMASGSITHNLQRVFAGGLHDAGRAPTPESSAFREWFRDRGEAGDWDALLDYRRQAPHAALMHPSDEHLLPFYVAAGAAGRSPALRLHASVTHGDLGMDAYAFGGRGSELRQALGA
jgi:4,5-DOPA dioxygenase extradiol